MTRPIVTLPHRGMRNHQLGIVGDSENASQLPGRLSGDYGAADDDLVLRFIVVNDEIVRVDFDAQLHDPPFCGLDNSHIGIVGN